MLTDKECKTAACPEELPRRRFSDSGGLYLEVSPKGSKRWFWKFYVQGKEKRMALGSYPDVSLAEARRARDTARLQKAEGIDPVEHRKVERLRASQAPADTFKQVAEEWYEKQVPQWSPAHAGRMLRQFERDLFPWIGSLRISDIAPPELLQTLRKVESRGALETADRALMLCRQVWHYALATGRVQRDVTVGLKKALTPYRGTHLAAVTDPQAFGTMLKAIDAYRGGLIVKAALRLAPLLFQRPGELRAAEWDELDLVARMWTIPAARMKRELHGKEHGEPHLVPLSLQAVQILTELQALTGGRRLVFPGQRDHDRPISDNSVRTALISLGYGPESHTWHGFRASARTMLAERLEVNPLVIEAQLAHAVKDANGRAYNRTSYLQQRVAMMQQWADYLDTLKVAPTTRVESSVPEVEEGSISPPMPPMRPSTAHPVTQGSLAEMFGSHSSAIQKPLPKSAGNLVVVPPAAQSAKAASSGMAEALREALKLHPPKGTTRGGIG